MKEMYLVYEYNLITGVDPICENEFSLFESKEKAIHELEKRVTNYKKELDNFSYSEAYSDIDYAFFFEGEDEDHCNDCFDINIIKLIVQQLIDWKI